jgi:hypothetical protein
MHPLRLVVFCSLFGLAGAVLPTWAQALSTGGEAGPTVTNSIATDSTPPAGPDSSEACGATTISVPSRPTVTSATDTTQCGVVEVEYGLERQWPGGGANRDDLTGGLRFGLTPTLDFHWFSSDFVHLMNGSGNRTGFGDTGLGLRYRFLNQTKRHPSFGMFYVAKIPSASTVLGGTSQVYQSFSFLASKDVHRLHFDFNAIELVAGRTSASGFDHNTGFALATWLPATRRLSVVFEPYGYTALNASAPGYASATLGCNYRMQPRLYLDGGLDVGVSPGAPRKRVFLGITYAVGNAYSWLRVRQNGAATAALRDEH